ncbi:MAG: LysR family transcriptional regulator [Acetobacteraceae bacterium]|nr:LysR family transcriptional regulator [Acetobacteraceae bacterium]
MSLTAALRDLNKINAFVRVAERRSFTKAAVDLRTTPSVISKHMTELEESLGFSLFHRSTHGIGLTDAGEGLFQNCLEMLAKLDAYIVDTRNLKTGPFGMLRVQATSGYARVLAPLIVEFARLHPGLRIDLSVLPEDGASAEEATDVIVAERKPALPGLVAHDLGGVPHVICAGAQYFRQFGHPKEPQELREHNCLVNLALGSKRWPFTSRSRPLLVEVKGLLSSNSDAVLIQMALQGCGIIRVPRHTVKAELAGKRLLPIFEGLALSPEHMHAYFSKAKHLPAKTVDFIEFLRSSIAGR